MKKHLYVPYDPKNLGFNIYKTSTYTRNLRVSGFDVMGEINSFSLNTRGIGMELYIIQHFNLIPTRLCHLVYCCGNKSSPT